MYTALRTCNHLQEKSQHKLKQNSIPVSTLGADYPILDLFLSYVTAYGTVKSSAPHTTQY